MARVRFLAGRNPVYEYFPWSVPAAAADTDWNEYTIGPFTLTQVVELIARVSMWELDCSWGTVPSTGHLPSTGMYFYGLDTFTYSFGASPSIDPAPAINEREWLEFVATQVPLSYEEDRGMGRMGAGGIVNDSYVGALRITIAFSKSFYLGPDGWFIPSFIMFGDANKRPTSANIAPSSAVLTLTVFGNTYSISAFYDTDPLTEAGDGSDFSGDLTPYAWWPHAKNDESEPIWNATTGAQLLDPRGEPLLG